MSNNIFDQLRRALWQVNYARLGHVGPLDKIGQPAMGLRRSLLVLRDTVDAAISYLDQRGGTDD